MSHSRRGLAHLAVGMMALLLVSACTGPAAPTATPTGGTPVATTPGGPTATPAPTAYPDPNEQASDPSTISDLYPNYGGEVDCDNGTFNGRPYGGLIKSISAPDPMTVVFSLCGPDAAFLSKVAFSVFAINDSEYLIAHTAAGDIKDGMNGTGPFKLDEWRRGDSVLYSRFDGYHGEAAATANGVLRWTDQSATKIQELQAGTVHGVTAIAPSDFDVVRNDPNLQLLEGAGLNTLYLGFNHDYAPWDNDLVRQALKYGINRQRIVDNFLPAGSEVASHFTPCGIPFGCTGDEWPDYDPDMARQLLADAGFPDGFTTTLAWRNPPARIYMPLPDETATDIQAQLAEIGITVTLDKQESGTFIGNSNAGTLEGLFLLGWGADYPDVTNFLDFHFGQGCTSAFGECYPEIVEPLNAGHSTSDEAAREAAYTAANNAILEQVPMVPISHAGFANAYLAGVENAQVSPLSNELLFRMVPPDGDQIVFMQNAQPIGLYCADETDGESLRACEQSMEGLYGFALNGTDPEPVLATGCDANADLTEWTCHLKQGVTFHNGATFEAVDVIVSFAAQWDALSALHVGNTGNFEYFAPLWGGFLNPPGPCGLPNTAACP
jgi:ABC-type transport system substrate-binding protein